jgi:hypothetical protein
MPDRRRCGRGDGGRGFHRSRFLRRMCGDHSVAARRGRSVGSITPRSEARLSRES